MNDPKKPSPPAVDTVRSRRSSSSSASDAVLTASFPSGGKVTLPSREAVIGIVEDLRAVLFPGYFGTNDLHDESLHYFVGATLARAMRALEDQVRRGIAFTERHDLDGCEHCGDAARIATRGFLSQVPAIRRLVASDVEAAYEGDPALKSRDEAIFATPASSRSRTSASPTRCTCSACRSSRASSPSTRTRSPASTSTPARASASSFFIDHGTGVVIGETSRHRRPRPHLPGRHARREELPARRARATRSRASTGTRSSRTTS